MMVELLPPATGATVPDPACGSGGFMAAASRYSVRQGHARQSQLNGLERDPFTAAFACAQLSLLGKAQAQIHCLDTLAGPQQWPPPVPEKVYPAQFDRILANPPFGTNLAVTDPNRLQQYQLGRRCSQKMGQWQPTAGLLKRQEIQLLFLERCLELLRAGGRLGIILPDDNLSNDTEHYIQEYMAQEAAISERWSPRAGGKSAAGRKSGPTITAPATSPTSAPRLWATGKCPKSRRKGCPNRFMNNTAGVNAAKSATSCW